MSFFGFCNKKEETPHSTDPLNVPKSGAGQSVPVHEDKPTNPPSVVFDPSSVDSIKASFTRLVKAVEELKELNEGFKKTQEGNLRLFSGEKDRTIANLRKEITTLRDIIAARDKEIERKNAKIEDNALEAEKLQADIDEKAKEVKRREDEVVGVRKELDDAKQALESEKKEHELTKSKSDELTKSNDVLTAERDELIGKVDDTKKLLLSRDDQISGLSDDLKVIRGTVEGRLKYYLPQGLLDSSLAGQALAFEMAASSGDADAIRVMAGLFQLRAAFFAGGGGDDKVIAVKAIGYALYAVWSSQGKEAQAISDLFSQWSEFLNNIPGAGFRLVLPAIGRSVPQSVDAPQGVAKVTEVLLWIVKGDDGSIYTKGAVR